MKKLTFKIQLEGIKPAIWRVLQVPSEMSVEDFAVNIQIAMDWTYSHMYGFSIEDREYWSSEFMEEGGDNDNVYPYDEQRRSTVLSDVVGETTHLEAHLPGEAGEPDKILCR